KWIGNQALAKPQLSGPCINKTLKQKFKVLVSDKTVVRALKIWRQANTRYEPRNVVPTFKHGGGSVMVWGCFSANGVGNLVFIDEKMNAEYYKALLEANLQESAKKLNMEADFIFQ